MPTDLVDPERVLRVFQAGGRIREVCGCLDDDSCRDGGGCREGGGYRDGGGCHDGGGCRVAVVATMATAIVMTMFWYILEVLLAH